MFTLNSHTINIWTQLIIQTFQLKLIRLIQEAGGLKKPEEKNRLYKDHPKGFYVYAKFKSPDNASNDASSNKNSKDIQSCVNYFIHYAGRPAMAENRITEYNKGSKTVSWFYMIIRMKNVMMSQIM